MPQILKGQFSYDGNYSINLLEQNFPNTFRKSFHSCRPMAYVSMWNQTVIHGGNDPLSACESVASDKCSHYVKKCNNLAITASIRGRTLILGSSEEEQRANRNQNSGDWAFRDWESIRRRLAGYLQQIRYAIASERSYVSPAPGWSWH
jgi:hypothetical protein